MAGTHAVELDLPVELSCLRPVFRVSLVTKCIENSGKEGMGHILEDWGAAPHLLGCWFGDLGYPMLPPTTCVALVKRAVLFKSSFSRTFYGRPCRPKDHP